ncbi:hypothetical protein [Paenibacillus sp. J2TS4]|uniref:hypothetical protein n=1 Tax=Paenibacillus sp. J2TS4 TaxID=2807194 RepID=UPI001B22890C|nr:hypothetical protein [Paenibacillus sp. J2TS4]GIP32932.1 hypothetical protein J2TS4_21420 [Paenibacillus sp. J2TS4]
MKMARVGILLDKQAATKRWAFGQNVFETYLGEVLSHAGIPYRWLDSPDQADRNSLDILIVALSGEEEEKAAKLRQFAEQGGGVISYAGLNRLTGGLGCVERPAPSPGYASLPKEGGDERPLRYLRSRPWFHTAEAGMVVEAQGMLHKDKPDGEESGPALIRFRIGEGFIDRWSVDIPYTIVALQQGSGPVWEDGIPAEDGTANLDEGILKADDKCEMDWEYDRLYTEQGTPYYAHPYADLWREALIHHLLKRAVGMGLTLPFLGYWPEGVPYVALISHDSDINQDEHAEATLEVLKECGIRSSWCMLEPGYSSYIYDQVKEAGHELAFHYNALDSQNGRWGEDEFNRQLEWMRAATGLTEITSNKNHYTRFEGWGELFKFCEKNGIAADQTRGPSKRGNIGFLFGTCHPYFPISWSDEHNRLYDVLQVGFLTQDLDHQTLADSSVIVPFLEQAMKVEGVAHFLFHQIHIQTQPKVADALRKVVREAKSRGFVFWTCKEINDWERARRTIIVQEVNEQGKAIVENGAEVDGVVVWIPLPDGAETGAAVEMKYGIPCVKQVLSRTSV